MTVAKQALFIRDKLLELVTPLAGAVDVVSNYRAMWDQASQSSQKLMCLICYMGERLRGPFADAAVAGRVDQTWNVAVIRGRGFTAVRGDTLTTGVGDNDPFYDCVEYIRETLRNMRSGPYEDAISQEYPVEFRSIKPMQLGSQILDGYIIEFSTANDLPALTTST